MKLRICLTVRILQSAKRTLFLETCVHRFDTNKNVQLLLLEFNRTIDQLTVYRNSYKLPTTKSTEILIKS